MLITLLPETMKVDVVDTEAQVGGGSLPGGIVPSVAVQVTPPDEAEVHHWQKRFRKASPPIITRIEKGSLYLDLRSLPSADDEELSEVCRRNFT